jgi:hypothetical protein
MVLMLLQFIDSAGTEESSQNTNRRRRMKTKINSARKTNDK